MSRQRTCFARNGLFFAHPDTVVIGVAHVHGATANNGHASFCDDCTARFQRAIDEQDEAVRTRGPLHHPGGRTRLT